MATTLTERPYKFSFCENEIRYVFSVSDPLTPGCAVEFELYWHDIDDIGVGTKLTSFALKPNPDGSIYCHVRDYLKSILSRQLPDVAGSIIQAVPSQSKKFYIKYRQVTTGVTDPDWVTDEEDFKRVVLVGGIEQIKFKRNNYFVSYMPANKPFLTWQPSGKTNFVFLNQVHFLTWLNTDDSLTGFTVSVKTVFTDGTDNTKTEASIINSLERLWRINVSVDAWQLHLIDPAKKIHYYEVTVKDGATVLANAYRFFIDYRPYYTYWDFNYFNSLGGIDPIRIKGEIGISVEISADETEHISNNNNFDDIYLQTQLSQTNIIKKDTYKGDAGWSFSRQSQEALIEFLISGDIFEMVDGRWTRILNLKKSHDLRLTTDKKWSFPIEWSYGYTDSVFTPKNILLGAGDNVLEVPPEPPCVAVELTGSDSMPDGTVGEAYSFSRTITGTEPFVLDIVAKPSWMTVAIVGDQLNFTGTPDVSGDDINTSISVSNCASDVVTYEDLIDIAEPPAEGNFTVSYTNNEPAVEFTLLIGNNGGSPTHELYDGAYSTDPVTGTDVELPAVDAHVQLFVAGKTILSCTCNGVAGSISTDTATWSGVDGDIVVNFTTD